MCYWQQKEQVVKTLRRCIVVFGLAADRIKPAFRGKGNVFDEAIERVNTTLIEIERVPLCPLCDQPLPENYVHQECADREQYLADKRKVYV